MKHLKNQMEFIYKIKTMAKVKKLETQRKNLNKSSIPTPYKFASTILNIHNLNKNNLNTLSCRVNFWLDK